jgi:1,2-diacylglycerol 3-beta-galactosyltransferase
VDTAKRILILTADVGFGHRSAAEAVAAALQERQRDGLQVDIVNPLNARRVPPVLRRSQVDYDRFVREAPGLYRFGYKASDSRLPSTVLDAALTVLLFESIRDLVRRHRPDAIVSTHPFFAHPLAGLFAVQGQRTPLLVVVTDLAAVHRVWFDKAIDLCMVATEGVAELAVSAGLAADQVRVTGIPVHPRITRERRPASALRAELGLRSDLWTVLAVGSRRTRRFADSLRALNHSGLPVQVVAVAGGDERLFRDFQRVEWHVPVQVHNFVKDMAPFMRAADCILSKAGGLIVTEALACGLPLLMIDVIPGQEEGNARYVLEGGAGERAQDPIEVLEILLHWTQDKGRLITQRAENARRLGRPFAAYEVADLAWQAAVRGPVSKPLRLLPSRERVTELLRRAGVRWKEDEKESA